MTFVLKSRNMEVELELLELLNKEVETWRWNINHKIVISCKQSLFISEWKMFSESC